MRLVESAESMSSKPDSRVLFCPFCRECYEGEEVCPEHELELVPFQELPRQAHERAVRWDEAVALWDHRFGRLELALGTCAALLGFFALPFVSGSYDGEPIAWTAFEIATSRAPNLWTVPFAAALFVVFLYRRRSPLQMRGARLAAIVLSLMPAISVGYSLSNIARAVNAAHGAIALGPAAGAWLGAGSSLLLLVGSIRFGGSLPRQEALPHGATADAETSHRIETDSDER